MMVESIINDISSSGAIKSQTFGEEVPFRAITPTSEELPVEEKGKKAKTDDDKEPKEQIPATADQMDTAVESLQQISSALNTHLSFAQDESSGRTVIKVINTDTGDLVRQIPSEDVLNIIAKMRNIIGVLYDQEA